MLAQVKKEQAERKKQEEKLRKAATVGSGKSTAASAKEAKLAEILV